MKVVGEGYLIHKTDGGNYCLCKILKEYGSNSEAGEECKKDFVDLLCDKTTEKKLR